MNSKDRHQRDGAPLTDKLLASITRHLNRDHLEDLLACARASVPTEGAEACADDWAEQVSIAQLDASGISLEVTGSSQVQSLRIDFPEPAKGVLSLKRLLGAMITESRAQLGWAAAVDDS